MFAVTNIDDILILALFFGQGAGHRGAAARVVLGQYLGFAAILVASVIGALGAGLLPRSAIPYLGLLPLVLGIRAAWRAWRFMAWYSSSSSLCGAPWAGSSPPGHR